MKVTTASSTSLLQRALVAAFVTLFLASIAVFGVAQVSPELRSNEITAEASFADSLPQVASIVASITDLLALADS